MPEDSFYNSEWFSRLINAYFIFGGIIVSLMPTVEKIRHDELARPSWANLTKMGKIYVVTLATIMVAAWTKYDIDNAKETRKEVALTRQEGQTNTLIESGKKESAIAQLRYTESLLENQKLKNQLSETEKNVNKKQMM